MSPTFPFDWLCHMSYWLSSTRQVACQPLFPFDWLYHVLLFPLRTAHIYATSHMTDAMMCLEVIPVQDNWHFNYFSDFIMCPSMFLWNFWRASSFWSQHSIYQWRGWFHGTPLSWKSLPYASVLWQTYKVCWLYSILNSAISRLVDPRTPGSRRKP